VAAWIEEYNTTRRHSTVGMLAPAVYEAVAARREARREHQEGSGFAAADHPATAVGVGGVPRDATGPLLRPQGR
jgi:hypothetical protein